MQIFVDADACPKIIKEILCRAAIRTQVSITFVSNQFMILPPSPYIKKIQVNHGFDIADQKIIEIANPNDLVITADIPLANSIVDKQAIALNPRGILYTQENIKQCLSIRNLNEELRNIGEIRSGPGKLSPREIQNFSNKLDQILRKILK